MPEIAAFACAVTPQRGFSLGGQLRRPFQAAISGRQQAIDLAHQVFEVKGL